MKLDIKQINKHKLQIERLSPFSCSPETVTTLLVGYTPIQNKKLKKKMPLRKRIECYAREVREFSAAWEVRDI